MRGDYAEFLLILGLLCTGTTIGFGLNPNSNARCIEEERQALLKFKQGLIDSQAVLSSWGGQGDCCEWKGVKCSNQTGHIVMLNLPGHPFFESDYYNFTPNLQGEISSSLLELRHLTYLDLSYSNFSGKKLPEFLGSFTKLQHLDLSKTDIVGTIPPQLGNLSSLIYLDLSWNRQLTEIHDLDWLFHLSSLRHLDMSGINLSLAVNWPYKVSLLPHLSDLRLSSCQLSMPIHPVLSTANFTSPISFLDLSSNNLKSSVFPWLFNFSTSLVDLKLYENELQDSIPNAFGNMNSLRSLDLRGNKLEGGIPKSFWNICSLYSLSLPNNNLSGQLFGFMSNVSGCMADSLEILSLDENKFTGPLPVSIGNLSNLKCLSVAGNSLEGVISEAHFSNLYKLQELNLGSNSLSFNFSSAGVLPFQLEFLHLRSCTLGTAFPKWLRSQNNLRSLDISDSGISDTVPAWFWDITPRLSYLNVSYNQLHGKLPDLSSSKIVRYSINMDFSSNLFEGSIPLLPANVQAINLSNNRFSGPISFVCALPGGFLNVLDLSNNMLSGELPDCLMYFGDLFVLILDNNNFSGKLPSSMGFLVWIQVLHLSNNSFVGNLPLSLQNCKKLISIDVEENKLSGIVPMWIGDRLPHLIILNLRSNQFYGSLPLNLCHLANIQFLILSLNNITGAIPTCVNNLTAMSRKWSSSRTTVNTDYVAYDVYALVFCKGRKKVLKNSLGLMKIIDLSSNKLCGEIPEGITDLTELVALNLSTNNLSGIITPKIGLMTNLQALDLSRNQLLGEIPASISSLSFLSYLDLSSNNLSGKIPTGTQLQSFDPSVFMGNPELCDSPLLNKCPGDPVYTGGRKNDSIRVNDDDDGFITRGFYVAAALGFVVAFWGVCCTLLLNARHIVMRLTANARMMLR